MSALNLVLLALAACSACLFGVVTYLDAKKAEVIQKIVFKTVSISMFTISLGLGYFVVTTVVDYF